MPDRNELEAHVRAGKKLAEEEKSRRYSEDRNAYGDWRKILDQTRNAVGTPELDAQALRLVKAYSFIVSQQHSGETANLTEIAEFLQATLTKCPVSFSVPTLRLMTAMPTYDIKELRDDDLYRPAQRYVPHALRKAALAELRSPQRNCVYHDNRFLTQAEYAKEMETKSAMDESKKREARTTDIVVFSGCAVVLIGLIALLVYVFH